VASLPWEAAGLRRRWASRQAAPLLHRLVTSRTPRSLQTQSPQVSEARDPKLPEAFTNASITMELLPPQYSLRFLYVVMNNDN
jgi:hypothetical protein